ncbi:bifunctional apoptosis regulator-like [Haliotis cracherodii]|uniref:bifunctional apoptosis regulator-like n=1 Tax=Haliotis cracherodii TaxID=6455 RepID=UPI0039E9749C
MMATLSRTDSDSDFMCSCCYELMVDPTTLVCGHNFCRVCLSRWFLTSNKKECPTCRQEWQGHPKINTALRNMMKKMYKDRMMEREEEVLNLENVGKVQEFDRRLSGTGSHLQRVNPGEFCKGIVMTLGVILIAYLVWFWRHSDDDLLIHKPVVRWKPDDVAAWLTHMGWAEGYADAVHQKGIDGAVLLSLDEENIGEVLNVTNHLHERALVIAIEDVRLKGVKMPSTLWEYKALYPGRCLFLLYGMKDFPRTTLLYLFLFYHEEIFLPFLHLTTPAQDEDIPFRWSQIPSPTKQQWVVFLSNAVLLPYWLIAKLTWALFSGQFWTSFFVLFSCAFLSMQEASLLKQWILLRQFGSTLKNVKDFGKTLLTVFLTSIVWPIIPRLVCDFFFYASLYFTPLQQAKHFYMSWRNNQRFL